MFSKWRGFLKNSIIQVFSLEIYKKEMERFIMRKIRKVTNLVTALLMSFCFMSMELLPCLAAGPGVGSGNNFITIEEGEKAVIRMSDELYAEIQIEKINYDNPLRKSSSFYRDATTTITVRNNSNKIVGTYQYYSKWHVVDGSSVTFVSTSNPFTYVSGLVPSVITINDVSYSSNECNVYLKFSVIVDGTTRYYNVYNICDYYGDIRATYSFN